MSKLVLNAVGDLTDTTTAQSAINTNNALVVAAFENTLSRNGTSPNTMSADLDMNSNRILNLPEPQTINEPIRLADLNAGSITVGVTAKTTAGTSLSSQTIGSSGTKTFTTQTNLAYSPGMRIRASDSAAVTTNYMEGVITSYDSGTGILSFTADYSAGSGTKTSWTLNSAGERGATGATGANGANGSSANSDYAFNYIINGAMMVSQENGATAGTTSSYYPVDQWFVPLVTSGTLSIAQVASVTPSGSPNRLRVTVTAADAAVGASDNVSIRQKIEGYRLADLMLGTGSAKTMTLRFGVKAPAGTYCVAIWNGSATYRRYIAEYTITGPEANTDVVKTIVIPGDSSGSWNTTNGVGMTLFWSLMAGSSFQGTAGSWGNVVANDIATSNQFNFMGSYGNVFELFDVGLYQASVAPTSYKVPNYADELRQCQRYYSVSNTASPKGSNIGYACFMSLGVSVMAGHYKFPVQMRATPSVKIYFNGVQNRVRKTVDSSVAVLTTSAINVNDSGIVHISDVGGSPFGSTNTAYDFDVICDARL